MNLRDTPKPFELSKEYIQKLVKKLEKVTEALFKSNKTDIIKNIRQHHLHRSASTPQMRQHLR
jgi:hypothetical protein